MVGARLRLWRPIHELSKVENEGRLDPVFFGGCLRAGSLPTPCEQEKENGQQGQTANGAPIR
jgi:hypothetical protein